MANEGTQPAEAPAPATPVKPEKKSVFVNAAEAVAETNTRNDKAKPGKNGKKKSPFKTYKVGTSEDTRFIVARSQGSAAALAAVEFGISIELIGGKPVLDPATYLSLLSEDGTAELAELLASRKKK